MKSKKTSTFIQKIYNNFDCIITDNFEEIKLYLDINFLNENKILIYELLLTNDYIQTYFCVIKEENKVIFFTYFQYIKPNENTLKKIAEPIQTSAWTALLLGIANLKIIVLGNIFRSNNSKYVYNKTFINEETAIDLWLDSAEILAKKLKCTGIVAAEIIDNSTKGTYLKEKGFLQQFPDVFMEMQIHPSWISINDYATDLTKKYAIRYKKIKESLINFELKTLSESDIITHQDTLQSLYLQTIADQEFVIAKVETPFWSAMKNIHKDNFNIHVIFINQEIVAFYSTLETNKSLEMYYLGYDKAKNEKHSLYFNLIFLGLEKAILLQKEILLLGRTSIDAKLNVGAKRVEKVFFIKLYALKGKMIDAWLCCQWKDRSIKSIERNPLKKPQESNIEKSMSNLSFAETVLH